MSILQRTIDYHPELDIRNIDSLSKGTGCQWLLVIESPHPDSYIAKAWKRKPPSEDSLKRGEWMIRFGEVPSLLKAPRRITRLEFAALCGEYMIHPELALENEDIVEALRDMDYVKVEELLTNSF